MREILAPGPATTRSSPASTSATSSGSTAASSASSTASSCHTGPLLGSLIDQQILLEWFVFRVGDNTIGFDTHQWQSVREDVVSDVVPPDGQLVQVDWVAVLQSHLDRLEVSVHGHIHARDGSVHLRNKYLSVQLLPGQYSNLGSILQLDGDCLVAEFHQEANKLHSYWIGFSSEI